MGFGSFLRGITAQVNPFDNGKTYGSYNAPKKKLQPGDPGYVAPTTAPKIQNQQNNTLTVQQPQNHFDTGISVPTLPGAPKPTALGSNTDLSPLLKPQPGQVIKPTATIQPTPLHAQNTAASDGFEAPQASTATPKPGFVPNTSPGSRGMQDGWAGTYTKNGFVKDAAPKKTGFWGHVGNGFKTAGQTAVGVVSNVPEVVMAGGRAATGIVQGVGQLPHAITSLTATGTKALADHTDNSFTRELNRGVQDANTGVKTATHYVVDDALDPINRVIDKGAKAYATAVPTATNGEQAYHATQVPINVLAALLTGGASTAGDAGEAANAASKLSRLTKLLHTPLTSNEDNVVAKTSQAISSKTAPVVKALNSPISSTKNAVTNLLTNPNVDRGLVDAGEGGQVLNGVEDLTRPPTQIQVQQPTPIEVQGAPGDPQTIPVTNNTPTGTPINEFPGDTTGQVRMPTPAEVEAQRTHDNFVNQNAARPDRTIDGVVKPNTGNTGVFTRAEIQQEQKALDDSLASGDINKTAHKAASAELAATKAIDDVPTGRKIEVKQVSPIDVASHTDVPTGLPETPGTVRATVQTAPTQTASEAVATSTPTSGVGRVRPDGSVVTHVQPLNEMPVKVKTPTPILPKDVQAVLDNPKQYNKVQVKAARNQARLATAKAKADEATAAAADRSAAAKPTSDKGFVQTGEYTKGKNGNIIQRVHNSSEQNKAWHDIQNKSTGEVLSQSEQEMLQNGARSEQTVRELKAKLSDPSIPKNTPEGKALLQEYKDSLTRYAQGLALADKTVRANGTGDQIANKVVNKLITFAEDGTKVTDSHVKQITDAENAFADARDTADQLAERFKASGNDADFNAWKAAQKQSEALDRKAKMTEYNVSKDVLKGNKNLEASKAIQDAEKNAGVYSMDSIDANMLSGTGTMVRNFVNTLFPRAENKLFGRASAFAARKLTGIDALGGSSGKGARIGAAMGRDTYKADLAARKEAGVGFIRRAVTAGNTVGEGNIEATTYSKAFSHYKQELKAQGYSGKELDRRAEFNVHNDPSGVVDQYRTDVLQSNALSGLTHNTKKIENWLSDKVQAKLADAGIGARGQQAGRLGAKAVTRVGLGFPTVVARSLVEGLKRATLGIPEAGVAAVKYANTGNKEAFASELSKAMQHAGSGGSLMLLGHALGKAGVISGAYPSDPAERQKWTAEGRQENSINIGGQWFSIPGYLGGFALPLMIGATTSSGNLKDEASFKNAYNTVLSTSPVDNIKSTLDIVSGNGTDAKVKNAVTSLVRSGTPAGALVAEIAKMTDSTQNDTTKKDALHNIIDSVAGGIPGLNNKMNTTDKLDSYGNVLHNPNPAAQVFGAQGSEQHQGTDSVNQEQSASDQTMQTLSNNGVTGNKSLMQLVDPKVAKEIQNGTKLSPDEVAKVQKAVTKGITATDDSNWRESGDYATDKAALQTKLDLLSADPTTKPSEKQAYQDQITRDDVLQKNNIPYDQLKLYQSTSLSDWRAMGDDTSDQYDPDTYQKLFDIDNAFTSAGVSYNKTATSKNKYSAKSVKAGSGKGSSSFGGDFGQLKAGVGAPTVQNYETLDKASGQIPLIQVQRPNIVHKISSSG